MAFITKVKESSLTNKQVVWLKGFEEIYNNHDTYKKYLSKTLELENRYKFEDRMMVILAKNSNRYKTTVRLEGPDNINFRDLGAPGTVKFLKGSNPNVENWIKKCLDTV